MFYLNQLNIFSRCSRIKNLIGVNIVHLGIKFVILDKKNIFFLYNISKHSGNSGKIQDKKKLY